jgi:very-short-patch-repair endonuclease
MNTLEDTDYIIFDVNGKQRRVRIVGTNDEPWFCGKDLCVVLEYNQPRQALQTNVDDDCKKSLSKLSSELGQLHGSPILGQNNLTNLSYNDGKAVYINVQGLRSLLAKSNLKTPSLIKKFKEHPFISQYMEIETIVFRKEQEYISAIKETFYYMKCKSQFPVGSYYIDLYIKDFNLAIECDEFGHTDRDPIYEEERQKFIEDKLGCHFIRFNPDEPNFSIFRVIGDINRYMLKKTHQCMNVLSCELDHLTL